MGSGHPLETFSAITQRLLRHLSSQSEVLDLLPRLTPVSAIAGGFVLWLVVVRALRWRRYNAMHRKYGPKWNNGLGAITPQEAQEIMHLSTVYDMPFLLYKALSFALFKTYAIVRLFFRCFSCLRVAECALQPAVDLEAPCINQGAEFKRKCFATIC